MKRYIRRVGVAIEGIKTTYKEEASFKIHTIKLIVAVILGIWLKISTTEWLILIIILALVLSLEIINSAVERVVDMVKPSLNQYVKSIKDMMAAAVLMGAITAVLYALIVFLPKIIEKYL